MTTHERELTEMVDLCTPDGTHLNPAARGWSRRPLHRANLRDRFGTNKRWDYWAVLAGDVVISTTFADVDHLGLADVYWADLVTGETGGSSIVTEGQGPICLPDVPGSTPLDVDRDSLSLRIEDDEIGTHFRAQWTESDGRAGRLTMLVELPPGHESVNVVIPWSDELFNFTSKQWARPASGEMVVGERHFIVGGIGTPRAWGTLDVGRGRWPSRINWNWGGASGIADGHVVGLQFGAKWTEGTGFTENGVIVDGRLSKIGAELDWAYDWDRPMAPWRVVDRNGQLDVTLTPRFDRHSSMEVSEDLASETHQVFGTWSGRLTTDDGLELVLSDLQGFAEEARQRW